MVAIWDAIEEMRNAEANGEIGEEADLRFHMAIANASHNKILMNLMRSVSEIMTNVLRETRAVLIYSEKKTFH